MLKLNDNSSDWHIQSQQAVQWKFLFKTLTFSTTHFIVFKTTRRKWVEKEKRIKINYISTTSSIVLSKYFFIIIDLKREIHTMTMAIQNDITISRVFAAAADFLPFAWLRKNVIWKYEDRSGRKKRNEIWYDSFISIFLRCCWFAYERAHVHNFQIRINISVGPL